MPGKDNWVNKLSPSLRPSDSGRVTGETCRVIIEYSGKGDKADRVETLVGKNQGKIRRELKIVSSLAVELPYAALEELARSKDVRRIWDDAKAKAMLDIAVPEVGSAEVQEIGFTGKGLTAAVIDTGIAPHPDLIYPQNRIIGWNDLVGGKDAPYDDNGHGTHVAGIIAGNGASSRGKYRGMAPEARLVGVKVLDDGGSGNISDIILGIEWCINHQAEYNLKAINLSLGAAAENSYRFDPLCRAAGAAWKSGMTVCAAAGNGGPALKTINTPGISPEIITVGNVDDRKTVAGEDDRLAQSSSRGPTVDGFNKPDLLAPGTKIVSLRAGSGYQALTGTSMSTAMVTGASLQLGQKWPVWRPNEIKRELMNNSRSLNLGVNEQGAGVLNLGFVARS